MRAHRRLIPCLAVVCALAGCARPRPQTTPAWPDTFVSRLQALALIQTLNADILSSRSATASLERWCRDHQLADDPTIVARVVTSTDKPATVEQRQRLQVTEREPVRYRSVLLRCGDRLLSAADNWYVPSRLTAEMNRLLDTTDTPFGRVVQPLEPYRRTVAVRLLWLPLPDGWERQPGLLPAATGRPLVIPDAIFEHRAVLYSRDHVPFSEVHEVYQRGILAGSPLTSPR